MEALYQGLQEVQPPETRDRINLAMDRALGYIRTESERDNSEVQFVGYLQSQAPWQQAQSLLELLQAKLRKAWRPPEPRV